MKNANNLIISNQITCKKCGQSIYSATIHDFKTCKCGAVSVDGGQDYLRRVGKREDILEQSIIMDKSDIEELLKQIVWAKETNRNDYGLLCAFLRTMRDLGYNLNK